MTDTDHRGPHAEMTRRAVVAGGLMAVSAAGAYAATPRRTEHALARHKLGDVVARSLGPWSATTPAGVIVPTEEVENSDGYDQQLSRLYVAPGLPAIMLLIAYGSAQGGTLQLHRPETCYPGQGFRISKFRDLDFAFPAGVTVPARSFTAVREDRVERLIYWTRIARGFPRSTAQEYMAILGSVLRGVVPDGILVRVSTTSADGDVADKALTEFAQLMIAGTNKFGRQILIGAA